MHTGFWLGDLTRRRYLENPDIAGRIILKGIFKLWVGDMDWIDVVQDTDGCPAVVNAVINLQVL